MVDKDKSAEQRRAELLQQVPLYEEIIDLVDSGKGVPVYSREPSGEVWIDEYSNIPFEEKRIYINIVLGVIIPAQNKNKKVPQWQCVGIDGTIVTFSASSPDGIKSLKKGLSDEKAKVQIIAPRKFGEVSIASKFIEAFIGEEMKEMVSKDIEKGKEILIEAAKNLTPRPRPFLHGRNAGIIEAAYGINDVNEYDGSLDKSEEDS